MKMTARVSKLVRQTLLAAPIALAPAASSVVLQSLGMEALSAGSVFAQEGEKQKPKYKTKKSYSLRQPVFKDFAKVQEKTDANDWPGALEVLNDIRKKSEKYTSFEKANLWNYYGWVYYSLENYPEALRYYGKVIAEEQLSDALKIGTLYTMAQLMFVQEDYRGAIEKLKQWMEIQPIVGADAFVLLAQGYYQLNDMNNALTNINTAVERFESKGKVPKENWYTLQRAVYFEKGDNKKVIEILHKLLRHYPKPTYWKQLSGMYGAEGQEKNQLHSLEVVYLMGELGKEKELLNLAYLFMGEDVPYKAARIIEKGMKAGIIEETSKNLEVLATAWRLAQNVKKSIPEMEKAAQKSDKGDLYARLAGIYLDNDQNEKALEAGAKAYKRKGIKRPDQLQIVLGMANANLGKYKTAIKEFEKAAKDKRSRKFARQWIEFAKGELKRKQSLGI
ncbi:tetratricopeptide repeat protein [Pseudomaricurvus alkylphenolicus]|jgi:tetratricopeptide (TPR) repeat protein|uniref:tetratricopeptide repeat protein n=1 Tax=Pseudomaricurvus alkylphenolicus TaxID=1306991 RepID=UPI001F0E9692|nr:tetratricopeptide repeat protein [Pseudomaricurvus alkylphenolicus]